MSTTSSSPPTPQSLLQRLRHPGDAAAWDWFARLYTPLLFYWARRTGLQESDAADLVQEVFTVLVRKLPEFRYQAGGSFRGWLRTVLLNKWRDVHRRKAPPVQDGVTIEEVPDARPADPFAEAEYRSELLRRALELLRPEFQAATWEAFRQTLVLGLPVSEVAAELAISVNAVYLARLRVMPRVRQEQQGSSSKPILKKQNLHDNFSLAGVYSSSGGPICTSPFRRPFPWPRFSPVLTSRHSNASYCAGCPRPSTTTWRSTSAIAPAVPAPSSR